MATSTRARGASKRPTLNDLAAKLGLSANTVSRALAGKDGVSDRTRTQVLAEAQRIGYLSQPEPAEPAQIASRTIALTIPSATQQFSAELIGAIESGARAAGYALDVFATDEDERQERQIAETVAGGGAAGAVIIPVQGSADPWARVAAAGVPLVSVSRRSSGSTGDSVAADNEAGSYAATRHLLSQGCRRIVQFEEDLAISTIAARRNGFTRALEEAAAASAAGRSVDHRTVLVPTRRFESDEPRWRATEAHRVCRALLASGHRFDAVVAGDDYFALGVMRALAEQGIEVGRDVRLVGYGDHPYAAWLSPALSSVRLPTQLIGELAIGLLLQRLAGETGPPVNRILKPELVTRASSTGIG